MSKKPILHLTNGYQVDFNQFARLVHFIRQENEKTSNRLPNAIEALGVTDKKIKYVVTLAAAFDLVIPNGLLLSKIGETIADHDQFFDDIGTLWIMHYIISSDPRILIWNRLANKVFPAVERFDAQDLITTFSDLEMQYSKTSLKSHLQKEVGTILDAYTNQQFSKLAYLREQEDGYSLGYRQPVPLLVLAAAITRFRERHQPGNTAVSVRDLLTAPNSPGVVFQMSEDMLRAGLEQLRHGHGFSLEARADLDQLRFAEDIPDHRRLERYYAGR